MRNNKNLSQVISDYANASKLYDQINEDQYDNFEGGQQGVIACTFLPPLIALRNWDKAAENPEEADKALELAEHFRDQYDSEPAVASLERAAQGYRLKESQAISKMSA